MDVSDNDVEVVNLAVDKHLVLLRNSNELSGDSDSYGDKVNFNMN